MVFVSCQPKGWCKRKKESAVRKRNDTGEREYACDFGRVPTRPMMQLCPSLVHINVIVW